jgi:site-specific DNA recombinase
MDVAIYARVSKEDQGTIDEQLRLLIEYAEGNGWQWTKEDIYKDEASATSIKHRPAFRKLLAQVKERKYQAVVVRHSDRITRTEDLEEWGLIMGTFQKSATLIASPHEGLTDITTLPGKMVEFTKGLMSSEENKKRNERVKQTKQAALDEGIYRQSGSVVYGYGTIPGNRAKKIPAKVVKVKSEAQVLREIYSLIVDEGMSASKVCVYLNAKGIKTRRGKDWRPSTLCSILRNTALFGEIISNRWFLSEKRMRERPKEEWKVAYIPKPIFSKQEWKRIQARLNANSGPGRPQKREGIFLCRGLLKCELCGSTYTTFWAGGSKRYYACPSRRTPKDKLIGGLRPCPNSPLIRQRLLDDTIWHEVVRLLSTPGRLLDQWIEHRESESSQKEDKADLLALQEQLSHYKRKYRYWLDRGEEAEELAYVQGKLAHWKALIQMTREKISLVEQRIEAFTKAKDTEDRLRLAVEALGKIRLDKKQLSPERRKIVEGWTRIEILAHILLGLPWSRKRLLLEAVVGSEKIWIKPSEHIDKVKPYWSQRGITVNFEYYLQGQWDSERIVEILEKVGEDELVNSLYRPRYRQCCS